MKEVPVWILEDIEDILRRAYNNAVVDQQTCFDRDVKTSLNRVRKILDDVELSGSERFEPIYSRKKQ